MSSNPSSPGQTGATRRNLHRHVGPDGSDLSARTDIGLLLMFPERLSPERTALAQAAPPYRFIPEMFIPADGVVDFRESDKPIIQWGIAITTDQMIGCARRIGIIEPDATSTEPNSLVDGIRAHLSKRIGLAVFEASPVSQDYSHVFTLYSNFELNRTTGVQVEKRAFRIMREVFQTDEVAR